MVRGLATRGAQIVLLTQQPLNDPFLVDYIDDLRVRSSNELITAEQVDLTDLHSVRTFATKWIDNAPPRRLDMVILCGNVMLPPGSKLQSTDDNLELNWGVNYAANYLLLSILSPALRAQPPDRDVRVVIGTCISYLAGELPLDITASAEGLKNKNKSKVTPSKQSATRYSASSAYASSKLALMMYAYAFQRQLNEYKRPDGQENNARVVLVDPGYTRTPGMQRYLTWGSLYGLFLYLILYPFWWLVLKSPEMGCQSFLFAAMEAEFGRGPGGVMIRECKEITVTRQDIKVSAAQDALCEYSDKMVKDAERYGAQTRAKVKKADAAKSRTRRNDVDDDKTK